MAGACLSRQTALRLLSYATGQRREYVLAHPDRTLAPDEERRFTEAVEHCAAGVPLAYITGEQEFFGLLFRVNRAVLIPRSDTECLVETALTVPDAPGTRVLELGTGSGCVAVTLAMHRPRWEITATDISSEALSVARHNAHHHGVTIDFLKTDWFEGIAQDERFDLILSNPPYIAAGDQHLDALRDEPMLALTDGADGLQALHHIGQHSRALLNNGGLLMLEHGYDQGPQVRDALSALGYDAVRTITDAAHRDRVAVARWP
jgi:release factor glutamine methyltransferase